jgi:hypothetical protein
VLQERVSRSDSHERIVETDGESRRGYPVDGEEEVQWFQAFYIEIKIYAAHLVKNKISDYVRALDFYSIRE